MKEEGEKQLFTDFPEITTSMWEEKIKTDLKGADYQKKLVWKSDEGIPVKPYYRQEDLKNLGYLENVGSLKNPSGAPNGWIICQDLYPGKELEEANRRIKAALKGGAQAIRIHLEGSPAPSQAMLEKLLEDIHPGETELHFRGCLGADALFESLVALARAKGVNSSCLHGSLGANPLGKMAESGIPVGSLENIGKLVEKVQKSSPDLKIIEVDGAMIQNAGSSLVEELAFTMAMASEYMAILTSRGMNPVTAQDSLQLVLSSGSNYFMEIAKVRAARILWTKIGEAYGIDQSKSEISIHSISSEWNMTLYDPHVNILRGTTEAMSSILGGADLVSVLPYDYPYGNGREFSDRIARNVQIILREEVHFDQVADPASGSYYIESLTDSMAEKGWELFCEVESMSGFRKAFETGWIQEKVLASRSKKTERSASGKGRILGTNAFPNFNELILDQMDVATTSADTDESHTIFTPLKPFRLSSLFEKIRLETEKSTKRPRVLLFKHGNPAWMTARATFSGNFFACAGYEIVDRPPFKTVDEGVAFCNAEGFDVVVLCSSDDAYGEIAPVVQKALNGKSIVVVAGYPADSIESLRKAGMEHFIHMKSNLLETLTTFNNSLL
ncbi:MAG: methylmalonyl-CoA mutase subunit beta [Bacteroidales bacterium]|nr:methylmalonyl-CoA mutase subunit beta [Bacteroidales bacterium]